MHFSLPVTVIQLFGDSSKLPTRLQLSELCSAIWFDYRALDSKQGGAAENLTAAKNAFVGWALNFGVRMLLKGTVLTSRKRPVYR